MFLSVSSLICFRKTGAIASVVLSLLLCFSYRSGPAGDAAGYGQPLRAPVLLDTLGYRLPYTYHYRKAIREVESFSGGMLLPVGSRIRKKDVTERWWKKQFTVVRKKRREPSLIVIDNKAWQVRQCEQRFATNPRDGDARVVLGCRYLLTKDFETALEYLQIIDTVMYTAFTKRDISELRGYAFYHLAREAQKEKQYDAYLDFLSREQRVYLSALEKAVDTEYFRSLYALTLIDMGRRLEEREQVGPAVPVRISSDRTIHSAQDAYVKALEILIKVSRMDSRVFEQRAFIYMKLGKPEKAAQERELQGRAARMSIFEKERKSIREDIFNDLQNRTLLDSAFLKDYIGYVDALYIDSVKSETVNLDSILQQYCDTLTAHTVAAYPKIETLSEASRKLLVDEMGFQIQKMVTDSLNNLKRDYLWSLIARNIRYERYREALTLIDAYGILIAKKEKLEELAMLRESIQERLDHKQEETRKMDSDKKQIKKEGKKDRYIERKTVASEEKTEQGEKLPAQIGSLIDDLIEKGEFVAAYRGVKAYEKLLKDNFDTRKIDTVINDLETLIIRDHGKKYLRKLQKELTY